MSKRRVLDHLQQTPRSLERNSVFVGQLNGDDNYVVHGEVFGNSDVKGTLMLAQDCRWKGNIKADVVIVKGRVIGNITANLKMELRDSATVIGRLSAPLISIAHRATLRGAVSEESVVTHFQDKRH